MTASHPPEIECQRWHVALFVDDVLEAADFYTKRLGFKPGFKWGDPSTMAAVNLGEAQLFLSQGKPNPDGCRVFFVVDDADALLEFHQANDIEIVEPIADRPWGMRDYEALDDYGHHLIFGHYAYGAGPPIEIERVDVPVRLEKRLAALLHDLALHKRMSLSSCLEEILLHTNEPLGDGVASLHTQRTLAHIQELKKKHGIDYDSHGSYRFVERSKSTNER